MNSKVLSFVKKCEGWKTAIKSLHWDSKNLSQHKLCDDIADRIADFQDQVSEVEQSISGKLPLNQLKATDYKATSLKGFVEDVIADAKSFLKELESEGDDYIGMRSDCESFLSDMQRNLYLVNFTLKEEIMNRLKERINESMPKNLANHDEVDKFMGRRPKTMKARINQIYRIVKRYGIDSKVYSDDHWQAKDDYYRAISSLGCDFSMRPCGDSSRLNDWDDITSDGGYCDYAEDGMPRSKQYAVKIMYDDGMNIGGYIKFMAAGTMEDPFSRYDTCMILWPKNNRELAMENIRMKKFTHNGENSYLADENPQEFWKNRGESLNNGRVEEAVYRLTEDELRTLVNEAVIELIDETRRSRANVSRFIASTHGHRSGNRREATPEEKAEARRRLKIKEPVPVEESEIKIKPSKEGTFTAAASKHGKSVQGFASQVLNNKDDYSPAMVKKANFARNASKWNKK